MRLPPYIARALAALDPSDAERITRAAQHARRPAAFAATALRRAEVSRWRREQAARRQRLRRMARAIRAAEVELGAELAEAECYARLEELRLRPYATATDVTSVQAAMLRVFDGASDDELRRCVGGRTPAQRYQWVRRGVRLLEDGRTPHGARRLDRPDPRTARWLQARRGAWRRRNDEKRPRRHPRG